MTIRLFISLFSLSLLIISCSAVPTTRYETKQKTDEVKEEKKQEIKVEERNNIRNILNEDYDVKRFTPDLSSEEIEKDEINTDKEIWYSFPSSTENSVSKENNKIIGTAEGFRVLVFSSDNLEELNEVHTKLVMHKGINNIYSVFEPPFYKLYIGDFRLLDDANSLRKKLIQLDFKESKVIRTTINLFQ